MDELILKYTFIFFLPLCVPASSSDAHRVSPGKGRDSGKLIAFGPVKPRQPGTGKENSPNLVHQHQIEQTLKQDVIVETKKKKSERTYERT